MTSTDTLSSAETDQDDSHDDGSCDEEHHDDESLEQEAQIFEPFEFTRLGATVSVHYDFEDDFFIGEV